MKKTNFWIYGCPNRETCSIVEERNRPNIKYTCPKCQKYLMKKIGEEYNKILK